MMNDFPTVNPEALFEAGRTGASAETLTICLLKQNFLRCRFEFDLILMPFFSFGPSF